MTYQPTNGRLIHEWTYGQTSSIAIALPAWDDGMTCVRVPHERAQTPSRAPFASPAASRRWRARRREGERRQGSWNALLPLAASPPCTQRKQTRKGRILLRRRRRASSACRRGTGGARAASGSTVHLARCRTLQCIGASHVSTRVTGKCTRLHALDSRIPCPADGAIRAGIREYTRGGSAREQCNCSKLNREARG